MKNFSTIFLGSLLAFGLTLHLSCHGEESTAKAAASAVSRAPQPPVDQSQTAAREQTAPPQHASNPAAAKKAEQEKVISAATDPGRFVRTTPAPVVFNITNPKTAQEHFNFAVDRDRTKQFDEAIVHYKKALELRPDWAIAHFRLARDYQNTGNVDAAIAEWKEAVRYDPHYYDAYIELTDAYRKKGDLKSAAESYEHLLGHPAAQLSVHYRLGYWYKELGERQRAREHLQSYIDLALQRNSKELGTDRYQKAVRTLESLKDEKGQ